MSDASSETVSPLVRHLVWVVALKVVVLAALWWWLIRPVMVQVSVTQPGQTGASAALLRAEPANPGGARHAQ